MNKTVTVSIDRMVQHERTHKLIRRTSKLLTHDERNVLREEDLVRIRSRPRKSLRKHFELDVVIKRGYEGREFDRLHPGKAAPVLTSPTELLALEREYAEMHKVSDTVPQSLESLNGKEAQETSPAQ